MYCLQLKITPTAPMTFRILPGSILNIATYPFVPPTTLSGYLRRLGMLSAGLDLPETANNKDNPPLYALPHHYIPLGAYPTKNSCSGVHRTYRKGMPNFNHTTFSKLYFEKSNKENFQLHTWEYLIADELVGYVVSESLAGLDHFQDLETYGCKLGKEGFAVLTEVSEPIALKQQTMTVQPSTIVPMESLLASNQFANGCDIYNLYRYNWLNDTATQSDEEGFLDDTRTPVDGFIPFVVAYYPTASSSTPTLDYYTNEEIYLPVSLVHLLQGEVYV